MTDFGLSGKVKRNKNFWEKPPHMQGLFRVEKSAGMNVDLWPSHFLMVCVGNAQSRPHEHPDFLAGQVKCKVSVQTGLNRYNSNIGLTVCCAERIDRAQTL